VTRLVAAALLAVIAAGCGRVGPPVRTYQHAEPPAASAPTTPQDSDPEESEEQQP